MRSIACFLKISNQITKLKEFYRLCMIKNNHVIIFGALH